MRLVVAVGSKVLGYAPLDAKRASDQDYLAAKVRLLASIHRLSILALKKDPVFYIQAPSKMNKAKC